MTVTFLGIGFSSPIIEPTLYSETKRKPLDKHVEQDHSFSDEDSSEEATDNDEGGAQDVETDGQLLVWPLYLHNDTKPPVKNVPRYSEPTVFFSVLWSNIFRNLYAGGLILLS